MFSFFRGGSGSHALDHIAARSAAMVGDARHSFDQATLALLTDIDVASIAADVRSTDERINLAEQELRSELVVHVSVHGSADIGSVLAFTLLLKKVERIGDQAKNILDLVEGGVRLADGVDADRLLAERAVVSGLFGEAGTMLRDPDLDHGVLDDFAARVDALVDDLRKRIDGYMVSDRPARDVVPLAFYDRYVLRILANLLGAVRSSNEPLTRLDPDVIVDEGSD